MLKTFTRMHDPQVEWGSFGHQHSRSKAEQQRLSLIGSEQYNFIILVKSMAVSSDYLGAKKK